MFLFIVIFLHYPCCIASVFCGHTQYIIANAKNKSDFIVLK